MRLTVTLLVASLAASVSAASYELCCCTKTQKDGTYKCDHDATQKVADDKKGFFAFTPRYWINLTKGGAPIYQGSDYIYATGKNYEDTKIGPKEMRGYCRRQGADVDQYCWSPGNQWTYNYKGDKIGGNGKGA
ncbi:hypothetical protein BLS_008309 [Venturia inaequalis]|uniref:Uncharacterized protein n=1 Tax=Venturia inaequalis TaxID=5025 RepID=A0A8H3UA47_VENIN|nr:hypothetical protein EG328_009300 [Venturia inaequalis]KAE9985370.1 hypothetical protein BLS_008309 [Venturia inaequalis]KAE9988327.1 hypothetical protein EG327_003396 [Venturia inaequalis]RDI89778.1 hypothetical protein Vi05172_g632 [Venturia inaequalis]